MSRRGRLHQPFEIGQQGRIFHQRLLAAAAGSPNPLRGYVAWRGQLLEAASNRGVRDPRGARHHRDAATPCCPGLRRGPNPPRSLAGPLAGVCFRPMSPSSDPGVAAELTRLSDIITRLSRGLSLADEPASFVTVLEEGAPGDE